MAVTKKLLIFSLSLGLSAHSGLHAAASSSWTDSLLKLGETIYSSTWGKIALASSASIVTASAVQHYRTTRPVAPPILFTFQGAPTAEEGVATLFVHGFGGDRRHAAAYRHILPGTIYTFDFPDAEEDCMVSLAHTGLGQPIEVDHLEHALRQMGARSDVKKIFVFGISRGGATVANLIKRAHIPHIEKITGFIIEQSFGSVRDILRDKLVGMKIQWIPGSMILAESVMKAICNQYSSSNQPIDNPEFATEIAKQKPILVTCSEQDALIPHTSTERLSEAFRAAGFSNLRHITFPYGEHAGLPFQGSQYAYEREMRGFVRQALANTTSPAQLSQ